MINIIKTMNGKPVERLTYKQAKDILASKPCKAEMKRNKEYLDGMNPTITREHEINTSEGVTPNKKIASPYPSVLTDTMVSFALSDISLKDRKGDGKETSDYIYELEKRLRKNNFKNKNYITGIKQLGIGEAYQLHFVKQYPERQACFVPIDSMSGVPVYSDTLDRALVAFIHGTSITDGNEEKEVITVYYDDITQIFHGKDQMEEKPNDYGMIPVCIYKSSVEFNKVHGLFQYAIDLIDAYDAVLTGNWNELEKFSNSLLLMMNELTPEDAQRIAKLKIFEKMSKDEIDSIKYLKKEVQVEWLEFLCRILPQEIHKACHVIDMYNPDSGINNAVSGETLKMRMVDMTLKAYGIQDLHREGFQRCLELITRIDSLPGEVDDIEIEYKIKPFNNKYDTAQKLAQIGAPQEKIYEALGWTQEEIEDLTSVDIDNEIKKRVQEEMKNNQETIDNPDESMVN